MANDIESALVRLNDEKGGVGCSVVHNHRCIIGAAVDLLQSFLLTEEVKPNPRLMPTVLQIDETGRFRA